MGPFTTTLQRIPKEVGSDVWTSDRRGKLVALVEWLYGETDVSKIEIRYSPSIIARSECELFGISSPRFALRARIDGYGFINLRRLAVTARQLEASNNPKGFSQILQDCRRSCPSWWIGDSLLREPHWLKEFGDERTMLSVDLAEAYGEKSPGKLTPFVAHLSIGGGLCAQAACFMGLCLSRSSSVVGIAEITRLANDGVQEFNLHGLYPDSIKRFIRNDPALNTQREVEEVEWADDKEKQRIGHALRTYLQNGIPVIVMMSISRMLGRHVGESAVPILQPSEFSVTGNRNEIPLGDFKVLAAPDLATDLNHDYHCVVLVGCTSSHFFINDPATFPFIPVTDDQLFEARPYHREGIDDKTPVPSLKQAPFCVMPLVPADVSVPLMNMDSMPGLLQIAIEEQAVVGSTGIRYGDSYSITRTRFHLIILGGESVSEECGVPDSALEIAASRLGNRWVWVQHIPFPDEKKTTSKSFWFWNASEYSLTRSLMLVVGVGVCDEMSFTVFWP